MSFRGPTYEGPGLMPNDDDPAVLDARAQLFQLLRRLGNQGKYEDGHAIGVFGSCAKAARPGSDVLQGEQHYSPHTRTAIAASLHYLNRCNVAVVVAGGTTGVAQAAQEAAEVHASRMHVVQVVPERALTGEEAPFTPESYLFASPVNNVVRFDRGNPRALGGWNQSSNQVIRVDVGYGWDERKSYLAKSVFLALLFEGGPGAAVECEIVRRNGGYVLPIGCTGGVAGGESPYSVLRPDFTAPTFLDADATLLWNEVCDPRKCLARFRGPPDGPSTLAVDIFNIVRQCFASDKYEEWRAKQERTLFFS